MDCPHDDIMRIDANAWHRIEYQARCFGPEPAQLGDCWAGWIRCPNCGQWAATDGDAIDELTEEQWFYTEAQAQAQAWAWAKEHADPDGTPPE